MNMHQPYSRFVMLWSRRLPTTPGTGGFSYIEALIAMLVLVSAMAIAMAWFTDFGAAMNTESNTISMQQAGRVVLDELARNKKEKQDELASP